jgi:hypothetical protein
MPKARIVNAKTSRRQFVKSASLLTLARALLLTSPSVAERQLGNNHVLVNGWILKKSDLID